LLGAGENDAAAGGCCSEDVTDVDFVDVGETDF
jgi:hypothetical protein